MKISVNGETREVAGEITISELLQLLEIVGGRIAVERNLEIVPRSTFSELQLQEGDCLEIVQFVGGG